MIKMMIKPNEVIGLFDYHANRFVQREDEVQIIIFYLTIVIFVIQVNFDLLNRIFHSVNGCCCVTVNKIWNKIEESKELFCLEELNYYAMLS